MINRSPARDRPGANVSGANLSYVSLINAGITNVDLTGCRVYGVSAWNVKLSSGTRQQDLVITAKDEPEVTVDNIEVAQFVYLLCTGVAERSVVPRKPGNAGGGKGPQFKTDARRGEGPGDWAT